jgi:hypothetical protein
MTATRKRLLASITLWLIGDSYDEPVNKSNKNNVRNIKIARARANIDFFL